MIFKDSAGDLWRYKNGQLECRLTLEGTGEDDKGEPIDEGWDNIYWPKGVTQCAENNPDLAPIIDELSSNPWIEGDSNGDELLLPEDEALERRNNS